MKKLLTIMILLLAIALKGYAEDYGKIHLGAFDAQNADYATYRLPFISTSTDKGVYFDWPWNDDKYIVIETAEEARLKIVLDYRKEGVAQTVHSDESAVKVHKIELSSDAHTSGDDKGLKKLSIYNLEANQTIHITRLYYQNESSTATTTFTLDRLEAEDGVTYGETSQLITTTAEDYKGIQYWINDKPTISGHRLVIKTSEAANIKVDVEYKGDDNPTSTSKTFETARKEFFIPITSERNIKAIRIRDTEASHTITFTEISIDNSDDLSSSFTGEATKSYTISGDVSANRFYALFSESIFARIKVTYSDDSVTEYWGTAVERNLILDGTKNISKIEIISTADFTLSESYLDSHSGTEEAFYKLAENEKELTTTGTRGMGTEADWTDNCALEESQFTNAKAGDILTIYATTENGAKVYLQVPGIDYQKINSEEGLTDNKFTYTLTQYTAALLRDMEVMVKGEKYTPYHITLTSVEGEEFAPLSSISLDNVEAMGDATYDKSSHAMTTTNANKGVHLYIGSSSNVTVGNNQDLVLSSPNDMNNLTMKVTYVKENEEESEATSEATLSTASKELKIDLIAGKKIKRIEIRSSTVLSEAITFSDLRINSESTATDLNIETSDNSTSLPFALGVTSGENTDWSKYVKVSKEQFASVKTGDIITVGVTNVSSGAQISLKDMSDGWPALEESTQYPGVETSATSYIYTVTATTAAKLKATGLVVSGHDLTISSLTLTPSETDVTQYSLTINSAENGSITAYPASSDGKYDSGAQVTLTATPASGYKFSKWSDDTTENPYTVTISADKNIGATFAVETPTDPTTVWTGLVAFSGTNFDTNDVTNTAGDKILAGVEAKDTIYIYTTGVASGASYKLEYKMGDSWTWTELISGTSVPEIIKYAATAESAPLIANRGLVISGSGYSINKISLHKFKETPLTAGETRTLWENIDGTAVTWNEIGTQGATLGAILEVGEKILVTVKSASTTETDRQVCLRDANSEIVTGFSSFDEVTSYPYVAKFTLTSDYVNKLQNGFHISGTNTTVTKMELYKPLPDTRTEKNLYGEVAMDSTVSDGITIAAEKFVNISEDDVLMIYLSGTKATDFITLRETTNWTQLTSSYKEYMTAGQTVFTLTLNDVNVAKLKAGGLNLTGGNFTITKITIKTNGEIPADEGGEEEGGDDDETIIDKKTGEADLAQLAAQDDTKTTLTQNEDGSITMTTTEAYQAAQIWFNDPEPVAGNVLKVELAELSVNVTVTVKYTDGTQSQMSANTMVAKARGETRSASGTTVEVPLESGKEVQNIEVKNNVAGTITIKKMQVTTVNVFTNGVANLSMLKPQSNATYDTAAHTLATTKGWTGATISPVANENVSGKELLIEFADASKVKVAVKYRTDVEGPSTIMEKAAKAVRLALDNTKNIQEISIQPTEAAIVTFTKIAVNSEETDDGSLKPGKTITLWENAAGETLAWNEVAKQDASVGETLKEYDELLITVSGVTKGCDWPKVFIRDASSEQAGNEVLLNDVGSFPYTVRIVLTGEMAQQLSKGFSICGDGVTVKKLQVYRPEAPKTGDIHLADLNYGYNSSYDKGMHTITTTARWAARGWEIGDKRYNDKNLITVKFEAVDFPVTLKMEYTTGLQTAQATSVGVPAGRTELLLEIPSGISKLNRVYIIYENPGSVKLTEASVTYQDNLKLSTAIRSFEADGVIRDGRYDTDGWYNLRGMRIPEPKTSGVYIHGGKKVVIY